MIKNCKYHGELNLDGLIKAKLNSKGEQTYRCKLCMKDLHRNHYEKNREKILEARKIAISNDAELKRKIQDQKNYSKRKLYALNPEKFRKKSDDSEKRNPQKKRMRQKRYKDKAVKELSDIYVKQNLTRGTELKFADIPASIVEAKREVMRLRRKIRETESEKH